jgi:glycosyltransferase involved in cell wall biosynthesis
MKMNLRVAYLTSVNPYDKKALSGVPYSILIALQKSFESVDIIGPVSYLNSFTRLIRRISGRLKKRYNLNHSYYLAWWFSRRFSKLLKGKQYDFIFTARSSTEIALLKTDIPIVYYSDTTFKVFYNYYEWFSGFMNISEWEGNKIEQNALKNSSVLIFTSEWAANSAISDYGADPARVHLIPFGPNIDSLPERHEINFNKPDDVCKLLFIGVEWERKGGEIAFETLQELKKSGQKTLLTVVGCSPPAGFDDDDMVVYSYLNKNIPEQAEIFNRLLFENHFLILPTRQECFGIVFCEASAFGLPSITTDTGGISGAVYNGINGYRLPYEARGIEYAKVILENFTDYRNRYQPLAKTSRETFENTLNWDSWSVSLKNILTLYPEIFKQTK